MKDKIKEIFINLGADLCGVASVDLFVNSPEGFHPKDIFSDCKSVIVFAKKIPKGLANVNPRIVYRQFNNVALTEIDRIAYLGSNELEKIPNAIAVPIPCDNPYDYWDEENLEGKGTLSMKHAAVLAGIGTLGKNTLLLNSKYGNMLTLGAVLTNLDLPSDPPARDICLKGCRICIDNCPGKAINENHVTQKNCRKCAYGSNDRGLWVVNCNKCRINCPMSLGL
ncbi:MULTISPECIES: epoxyqueuosine reductase [Clostridium]|uniref:Epoxyqueuosine reductase n=1 Tax=Clostridium cibarium TaxID=2762247 RepID=A0ABR8PWA5_9CLOT|nr:MULTISPECIES: epoxyqueuosine reductase [Clostridium]MBD7912456.1 epoxyqueuosine reductase [Clostridium cibarium]